MLWQLFLITTIIWLLSVRFRNRNHRKMTKYFKNSCSLPIMGDFHNFVGDDEDRMNAFKKYGYEALKEGGMSSFWLANRLYLVAVDPVEIDAVLKNCLEKDEILRFTKVLLGNGSIFAPVSIWRPRRKVLAPTFGQRNLNNFVSIFAEQSNVMVNRLEETSDKGTFSLWKYITSYTMDSVCQTTLGTKLGIQSQENHPFLTSFERLTEILSERMLLPWLHSDFVFKYTQRSKTLASLAKYLTTFVIKIIQEKRLALKNGTYNKNAVDEQNNDTGKPATRSFLELLIDSSGGDSGYTDLELREETMVMLLAGTDTSAVGAGFTTLMLSKHQDVQEKVYQEVIEVCGEEKEITAEVLPRLKYLDAVVKESLRLYPPVPIIIRNVDKDFILPSGRKIVKNTGVIIHIWGTHRNQKYWGTDAEAFRPERFFDLHLEQPAAYIPFSHGPRSCLGYQYATISMKTVLATLVRRFKILPSEQMALSGEEQIRVKYDFMMKDVDHFKIKLLRRK